MVDIARNDPKMKEAYMFTELYIQDKLKEGIQIGIEQGIKQGREQGVEQGREQGSLQTLFSLYQDWLLSLETAAAKAGLSHEEFLAKAKALIAE